MTFKSFNAILNSSENLGMVLMRVQTEITVVEHEGELLFRNKNGKLFDALFAWNFVCGELKILRDSRLLAETSSIRVLGSHIETECFCGLDGLFPPDTSSSVSVLEPKSFQPGDTLTLNFDFELPEDEDVSEEDYVWAMPASEGVFRLLGD